MSNKKSNSIFEPKSLLEALKGSIKRLNPIILLRNPVMLIVEVGAIIATLIAITNLFYGGNFLFNIQISIWLWFTVIFSNFAESLAEARGKARAQTLKNTRTEAFANKVVNNDNIERVPALSLKKMDVVIVKEGETIPSDGDIINGTGLVDESAITGESAPVIRESGGDISGVTGGTKLLSGEIKVKITVDPGETFLDSMINMVESAKREKTPNEKALEILLVGLTGLFIVVVITLTAFANYMGVAISVPILIALLVCLMPTTIGALLPAIGIAGMDRLLQHNVIALSGRAVEASGDVSAVLLDKTGTITLGSRKATEFIPVKGIDKKDLIEASLLASLADETPEGRSIVILAKKELGVRGRDIRAPDNSDFVPFTPETRMSGIDYGKNKVRKGAASSVQEFAKGYECIIPVDVDDIVNEVSRNGDTPLVVADCKDVFGVIRLKDVVKKGIKVRLQQLRQMGIKSVMITGDNPLTAASIAAEAGVDDFIAEARPETKLELIRKYQGGETQRLVAMIGDGTNDAPALAQADVAVAMSAGTAAAREAANMVDLDSSPAKLLDIVEIGKEILITRGALTTFSIATDVAKYFAIIPAIFAVTYPQLNILNVMHLSTPMSAVLAAVIFNAIIIPLLIPLALRGVKYRSSSSVTKLLGMNILIYGLGGLALPFIGIKLIDILISFLGVT
ncbi:MAG: potassium-transporting ATPase subunit KdpB [Methanobacterium sp.]|uniref:potassium-transporting ATPase subunit KdpB n=1 Tax=Methanobacterium sp. TaxID=2164 RepID=UPI003C77A59F